MNLQEIRSHLISKASLLGSKGALKLGVSRQALWDRRRKILEGKYPSNGVFLKVFEVLGFAVRPTESGIQLAELSELLREASESKRLERKSFSDNAQLSDAALGRIFRGEYVKGITPLLQTLELCGLGVIPKQS